MTAELRDAISGAIEETILRVTDGTVRFTDEQLRRIGDEFLYGERVFGTNADIEPGPLSARITVREPVVPAASRRPAPIEAEIWEAHPKVLARQLEHATDEDPNERRWMLVPQPTYSPDTPYESLPARVIRQCCQHKDCGGTDLYRAREETPQGTYFLYRRGSNDEQHEGFGSYTVSGLVAQLNDPAWWPNRHTDVLWDYVGRDGLDAFVPEA